MVNMCAEGLNATIELIRKRLTACEVGHFDETGTRVDWKTMWGA